jgi:tRNA U34 5-methylaminomethyl-2-thiouridine-forming methyltransferase MnmC
MNASDPVITKDGSHTLFNKRAGEHYHSIFGAIQESEHIFIRAGLESVADRYPVLNVLEIGLGTGLNVLLSMLWAEKNKTKLEYLGLEAFPLDAETLKNLNYPERLSVERELFLQLLRSVTRRNLTPYFSVKVLHEKFQDFQPPENRFHVVFFDAFSPESQPEMWTKEGFVKLFDALVPQGVLVTYSCKGDVKRALKAAGFHLEKLPGPPGKREFLRATAIKK